MSESVEARYRHKFELSLIHRSTLKFQTVAMTLQDFLFYQAGLFATSGSLTETKGYPGANSHHFLRHGLPILAPAADVKKSEREP
jgi:hypothetical protein